MAEAQLIIQVGPGALVVSIILALIGGITLYSIVDRISK